MLTPKLYPLAAICQAAQLALQLATTGQCDEKALAVQIHSLFVLDPLNVAQIYGDAEAPQHLKIGLSGLAMILQHPQQTLRGITAHILLSFCTLAKRILSAPASQKNIRLQLERIQGQVHYFGALEHPRVMENLSLLYLEVANTHRQRLKIIGQKKYLNHFDTLNKIRAVLFSGVRAAILWYQLDGNLFWLLWQRKKLLVEIKNALS